MKPKIHHVNSYRDIPTAKDPTMQGFSIPKTGDIYAIKGKTTEGYLQHEIYHVKHNHPVKPRDFRDFIDQEIKASYYAYKTVRQPKRIMGVLRAIFNDVTSNIYNATPYQAMFAIRASLNRLELPSGWRNDYKQLEREYTKAFVRSK